MLIVFAGLPGSGKSTIARALGRHSPAPVLSVDPVEAALLRSGIEREQPTGLAAYVVVEAMAADLLSLGQAVIVDAVNDAEEAREQWRNLAERQRAPLVWIEVVCSDPDLHRRRLAGRERDLPGFPEPAWASLETRRPGLAAWMDERLILDSVREPQTNVETALDHLRTARVRGITCGIAEEDVDSLRRSGNPTRRGRLPEGDGPDS
ncbi:AAA family ATPase [Nocardiopsis sp. NPDC055551]|uniref:AAA family ATPase n=1 Tax=Nocardiopsis sp. NPDC006832 TaxID=3157188 RepID=UPI0033C004EF